jgi:hypothetical protein
VPYVLVPHEPDVSLRARIENQWRYWAGGASPSITTWPSGCSTTASMTPTSAGQWAQQWTRKPSNNSAMGADPRYRR